MFLCYITLIYLSSQVRCYLLQSWLLFPLYNPVRTEHVLRHICLVVLFPHLAARPQSSAHTIPPSRHRHLLFLAPAKIHTYLSTGNNP